MATRLGMIFLLAALANFLAVLIYLWRYAAFRETPRARKKSDPKSQLPGSASD
jgi:hypothetical protein